MKISQCPDCGMVFSDRHAHVCMADKALKLIQMKTPEQRADIIADELLRRLECRTIKKIDIDLIRQVCLNDEPLVELVLRRVVYKVG